MIQVQEITKLYGNQKVVDEISFSIEKNQIVGLLGPNGAGKSTTMKLLLGYLTPHSGSITIEGLNPQKNPIEVKKKIGYLSENNPLYSEMYVKEFLEFIAQIHGIQRKSIQKRVSEVISIVGLLQEQNKKIEQLSKGYKQRVGLAQALLHNPKILILDEPTTGLDPNQIVEIRQLIKAMSQEKIVILSTHIMQEVEALCDRVIIINKGKKVIDQLSSDFKEESIESVFKKVTMS